MVLKFWVGDEAILSTFEVACPLSRVSERLLRAKARLVEDVSECTWLANSACDKQ